MSTNVRQLTRTTATSTKAIAKRAAELIEDYFPDVVDRVVDVEKTSSLDIRITVKPAGRTEGAKDPEVIIAATPSYGPEVVKLKARLSGEGDSAQLSLIHEMVEADEFDEAEAEVATG